MKTKKLSNLLPWIAGLALLMSACSPDALPSLDALPSPDASSSAEATPTMPAQPQQNLFEFEGVSFDLDPAVASGASGQIVPEKPGTPDGPYWDINPQYTSITLDGYPVLQPIFKPALAIYPVNDYRRLSPEASSTLDKLTDLLDQQPAEVNQVPALPVINAGQVFHTGLQYMDFQNGSGVRFLTVYSQAADPITNQSLVYVYQGLTSDGQHAVSVFLPVSHPSLLADPNALSAADRDAIFNDYGAYLTGVVNSLSGQPDSSYIPSLEELDALIKSIRVE
jgi:hypothetical protein